MNTKTNKKNLKEEKEIDTIVLNNKQSDKFLRILNNPPKPNDKLKSLFK